MAGARSARGLAAPTTPAHPGEHHRPTDARNQRLRAVVSPRTRGRPVPVNPWGRPWGSGRLTGVNDIGPIDPHADLVGSLVTITLTNGSTLSGGRLLPRATAPDRALVRVDLGSGNEIMLHPEQVRTITPHDTAPRAEDGSHRLAQEYDTISDAHWVDAAAVHQAASAVVGLMVGADITSVMVTSDRAALLGGCVYTAGTLDAQRIAVYRLAGPLAHGRRVGELGYGPTVQAAVDVLLGQSARSTIADLLRSGFIVWETQAYKDAGTLLDQAGVWETVLRVGAALAEAGSLSRADLDALVGDPGALCDHRIWTP